MKTLSTSNPSELSSLLFFAALLAHAATGCSSKINGFVPMGGDMGGSSPEQSANTGGNAALATGGAATTGGAIGAGGSVSSTGAAQAGTTAAATGGATAMPSTHTGGFAATSGGVSAAGGTHGTTYTISTSVGAVKPTCTGTPVSEEQLGTIEQAVQRNDTCRGMRLSTEPAVVSLLFLVDATEAMALPVQDSTDWRWDVVKRGILGFIEKYSLTTYEIGVGFYGAYRETTTIANCGVDGYVSPAVSMDRLASNAANIASHFDAMRSRLRYPATLYPALDGALSYASAWQSNHVDRATAVVLVTDGRNQVCDKTFADDGALVQGYAQHPRDTRVETFVIGVAGDPTNLDVIADGGGTARAYLVDGPAASDQFTASVDNILNTMQAYFAPSMSLGNASSTDPAYVLVRDDTLGNYVVPRVSSETECNTTSGGWYFTTDTDGQSRASFCACSKPNVSTAELASYYACTLPFYPGD